MFNLLNLYLSLIAPEVIKRFDRSAAEFRDEQDRFLMSVIRKNEQSEFGRLHNFHEIRCYHDFCAEVPISNYDDLKPYIDRSMRGEPGQLTAEAPCFYAMTSGTTGTPKFIPVTPESAAQKSALMRVWLSKIFIDHPKVFDEKILTVISPAEDSKTPAGVVCGAESGHGYRKMPEVMQPSFSTPYDIYTLENYDAKYYAVLRIAAEHKITIWYTCNPSTVILLGQRLGQYSEEIIRDVRDGTLSERFEIPEALRKKIAPQLKKNPARAAALEQARAEGNGSLIPRHVWPELAAVSCWKGGNVRTYLEQFPNYFRPDTPIRDIGYLASEFRGSVPLGDTDASGVLAVGTNFYEFSPADLEPPLDPRKLLRARELEQGKRYYIYVTTSAGLYRYDMNDLIEVNDFYQGAPVITFIQKGKGVVSFTGEKLYESQAVQAVGQALQSLSGNYDFISGVGRMIGGKPRYDFLVEFAQAIPSDSAERLAAQIDRELCTLNPEYKAKRFSDRIDPAALRVVKDGEFDRYRQRMVKQGRKDGQFKMIKLTDDESLLNQFDFYEEAVPESRPKKLRPPLPLAKP